MGLWRCELLLLLLLLLCNLKPIVLLFDHLM
jgi:hypothetical protein